MAIYQAPPSPIATPSPKETDMERRHSAPTLLVSSPDGRHDCKVADVNLPLSPSPSPTPVEKGASKAALPVAVLKSQDATVAVTALGDEQHLSPATEDAALTLQQHRVNEQTQPLPSASPPHTIHLSPSQRSALLAGPTVPVIVANQTLFPAVPKALLTHFSRKAASMFNTHNATSMTFATADPSVLKYIIHHLLASCSPSSAPPTVYSGHLDKMLSIYHAAHCLLSIPALSQPLRKSIMDVLHSRPLTAAELRFITQKFAKEDQLCKVAINKTIDFRIEENLLDAERIDAYLATVPALEAHFVELTEIKFAMMAQAARERAERHEAWLVREEGRRERARRRMEWEAREAERRRRREERETRGDTREEGRGRPRRRRSEAVEA